MFFLWVSTIPSDRSIAIAMAVVGTEIYPKAEDVKGYLYVDEDSGNLCLKVEHVYVELSAKLASEAWKVASAPQ